MGLLPSAFSRILGFYMFARHEAAIYLRFTLLLYSLNIGFDLTYTGLLRLGAKGIPLGLLSSALATACLAHRRNLCELREILNRSLGAFSFKVLLAALTCGAIVMGMRMEVPVPGSSAGVFVYLCALCGAGSVAFLAVLLVTRALPKAWLSVFSRGKEGAGSATTVGL